MATYESYKDSGVKWLGQIPSHWEVKKLRAFFSEVCDINSALKVRNQLQFKYGTIVPKPDSGIDETVLKTISKYTVVNPGDIIINGLNLNYYFISFRVGKVNESGVITSAYIAMRPNSGLSPKFYEYMLKAMDAKKVFHGFGTGIRSTLSFKELKHKLLPLVPLEEQEAIVAYLDNVTAEINRAIEAQQKMIDALNERKQIIITRAVTRGLNPDAPLRDSSIDWLGKIPAHWDFCKLKYFIRIKSGDSISNIQLSDNGKYLVYGGGEPLGRYNQYNIDKGNIVIGRVGARCGCITPIYEKAWATDNALIVSCEGIDYQFLIYCLIAADLNKIASTNAQPLLTGTKVKNTYITVPNLSEQKEIVSHIERATKSIYLSIANCERMISLLQERKQIIINEIVTGKKKVI